MSDLLRAARLGIEVEAFLRTPVGKYLHSKALSEIEAATELLIEAQPDDERKNREIRNQIHVARMFLVWMSEAINVGEAAHEQIKMDE
jgi:hypothetical protein